MGRLRRYRFVGGAASVLIVLAGLSYGVFHGGYLPTLVDWFKDGRDIAANAVGFRIAAVAIVGHKHLSREEILAIAGIGGRTSLLFLDAAETRAKLKIEPVGGRRHRAEALSRPARHHRHGTRGLRAVADGGSDQRDRR